MNRRARLALVLGLVLALGLPDSSSSQQPPETRRAGPTAATLPPSSNGVTPDRYILQLSNQPANLGPLPAVKAQNAFRAGQTVVPAALSTQVGTLAGMTLPRKPPAGSSSPNNPALTNILKSAAKNMVNRVTQGNVTDLLSGVVQAGDDGFAYAQGFSQGSYYGSFATFYGERDGSGTMGGACGYGNMFQTGYGLMTAAASYALFDNGKACGACFEVKCLGSPAVPGKNVCSGKTVTVTITNSCPPGGNGVCNPPKHHLDMSEAAWGVLSGVRGAGILETQMRRVPCKKNGGVAFMLTGNPYYLQVLVFNVAGPGNINKLEVSDGSTWDVMDHNWGASYSKSKKYGGKELSFRLTAVSGDVLTVNRAVPSNWYIGAAYMSRVNFGSSGGGGGGSSGGSKGDSNGNSSPKKKHPGKPKKKKSPPPSDNNHSNSPSPPKKKKKKSPPPTGDQSTYKSPPKKSDTQSTKKKKHKKQSDSSSSSSNSNKNKNNNNNNNGRKTLEIWGPLEEIQLSDWERDALLGKVMEVNVTAGAFGQH